tara:strand:+ start:4741 stop:4986 length:246 start_codon:yes stop_codon:yes gene_type:complete
MKNNKIDNLIRDETVKQLSKIYYPIIKELYLRNEYEAVKVIWLMLSNIGKENGIGKDAVLLIHQEPDMPQMMVDVLSYGET